MFECIAAPGWSKGFGFERLMNRPVGSCASGEDLPAGAGSFRFLGVGLGLCRGLLGPREMNV